MTKTITPTQAKQADELGQVLVKVLVKVEPQPISGIETVRLCNDLKYGVFNKEISAWRIRTIDAPFNLNDEVCCEDEQDEWFKSRGFYFKKSLFEKPINGTYKWESPATMPASLASKSWKVTGIEVVEVETGERKEVGTGLYSYGPDGDDYGAEQKFVIPDKKEWYWKILMQENTNTNKEK